MNIKALVEKRSELLKEAEGLLDIASTEVRGLDTEEKSQYKEITQKISEINETIQLAEERSKDADEVEEITIEKSEERNMENMTLDQELRAVEQFIKKQDGEEIRAIVTSTEPGKLTVPTTLSNLIVEKLFEVAPLWARTRNFTPVNGFLEVLREQELGDAGFVGEMTNGAVADFKMSKVRLDQKRCFTGIEISQHMINDSGIDISGYATSLLGKRMGYLLDRTILTGDATGATKFQGLLNCTTIEDVKTVSDASALTTDDLLDLYNSVHPQYLGGAVVIMGRKTFNTVAKLKDGNGHYFLVRAVADGPEVYRLFGLPVVISDAMPEEGRGVILANLSEGYATMTKKGLELKHITGDTTQALRGSHLITLDMYADGKVLNEDAIKAIKFGSSSKASK